MRTVGIELRFIPDIAVTLSAVLPRLGIDLGELEHEPEALYAAAHLAYIAAGAHAGDDRSIALAIERAQAHDVILGAHPSFEDRARFGRVDMDVAPDALRASVRAQCERVRSAAARAGLHVRVFKLHGALYHRADRDPIVAAVCVQGAIDALGEQLTVVCAADRHTARAAIERGCSVLREAFADRATLPDGTLVPRTEPGAVLTDPALAVERARSVVRDRSADVLCVHGDHAASVALARAVRAALDAMASRA